MAEPTPTEKQNLLEFAGYENAEQKEHFAAIGRVASEWAILEFLIDLAGLSLARIEIGAGSCLTSQIAGHSRKLDAYIAIARHQGMNKLNKELDTFAKDTGSLAEQRNRIIHDPGNLRTRIILNALR